ncbi:MAG: Ig-like domain-containing protein [bacterium]|nr:Ig-like domain-containing protein [bacterium]
MRKGVIFLMIMTGLLACSREESIRNPLDTSLPSVIETSPSAGSYDVSKFSPVTITFSEEMDASSVSASGFSVIPPLPFSYEMRGSQIKIVPAGSMPDGQRFYITVKKSIRDLAGNTMANDYYFSFKVTGNNYSRAPVTFRVDDSIGRNYFSLFLTASFDRFGDYDPGWNSGTRCAFYDDGLHDDKLAGDGVWGYTADLTADNYHSYSFGVDEDEDSQNGYLKGGSFFVTSTSPKIVTVYLYPPVPVTFNYFDRENKVQSSIFIKGEFNNWANIDPMTGPTGSDRKFTITRTLKEGTYNYKYYADSSWNKVNTDNRTITVTYPATPDRNDYDQGGYSVAFNYYDIENKVAGDVYLKGDFNSWGNDNKMTGPAGPGRKFTTTISAVAGTAYTYKYYADSSWDKLNLNNRSIVIASGQSEQNDYYSGSLNVTFNYYDYEGKVITSILIAGEFNGWTTTDPGYQMVQDSVTNYKYSLTLPLNQGTYKYKYYADNNWDKLNTSDRTVKVSSTNSLVIRDLYQ